MQNINLKTNAMKTIVIILTSLAIILIASKYPNVDFTKDNADGIQFYKGPFKNALKLAKKENKLVFLDIYATWCGPCKKLKSKTFSDSEVGLFYNQAFVNVSLNGEQGEGLELAYKYDVHSYPTLLFFNAEGKVISLAVGYHNKEQFLTLGRSVINKNK